jgi:glycolate oxidase iron-sulfur subunit
MAASEHAHVHGPALFDLDHCLHCGLCLNACPTYRELGLEMDSPRGRIYQMVQVAQGSMPITDSYREHIGLCLACRGCESACPSGVQYGRLIEAARTELEAKTERGLVARSLRGFIFSYFLESRELLAVAGALLWLYQASGLQRVVRGSGLLKLFGKLDALEALAPDAQAPFFFSQIGRTFPAEGEQRYRVAFLAGCIANVAFARLNEATIRVLQKNGCQVVLPYDQTCCGALHVHSGMREDARRLARRNIDAIEKAGPFDAIITNAAGCGSTLKEYDELLADDPAYKEKAEAFKRRMRDITEFLSGIELNRGFGRLEAVVTYQDSCHLLHGQKVKLAPRKLLAGIPGVTFRELPGSEVCCGSAGIYNAVHTELAMQILEKKMAAAGTTGAGIIATANPGCLLQLKAGARRFGSHQRVVHVVELMDEAYRTGSAPGSY